MNKMEYYFNRFLGKKIPKLSAPLAICRKIANLTSHSAENESRLKNQIHKTLEINVFTISSPNLVPFCTN